ncbi:MAG: PepSY domain-containing protein [Chitinophagaceae bacterium]|nr:PepSY domain-containing protein [Chitinophagaceae bacterium]
MWNSLLQKARIVHRKIASVLYLFFFFIAITGIMLAWKSIFTTKIYEDKSIQPGNDITKWMALPVLEKKAVNALNEKVNRKFKTAENLQLKMAKGYISFAFKDNYNVQLDGATGNIILIEKKYGSLIQDIHDGAIIGDVLHVKSGLSKTVYSVIMGCSLLLLTISGFYLWFKPKQLKKNKAIH